MKLVISRVAVVLAFLNASLAVGQEIAVPPEWRQFRDIYPYHVQGVAVSKPRADGSRVVIVAEPPPHMGSAEAWRRSLPARRARQYPMQTIGTPRLRVGVGGGGDARRADRAAGQRASTAALHREMFGTMYKARPPSRAREDRSSDRRDGAGSPGVGRGPVALAPPDREREPADPALHAARIDDCGVRDEILTRRFGECSSAPSPGSSCAPSRRGRRSPALAATCADSSSIPI